jgi:hypothetical protein
MSLSAVVAMVALPPGTRWSLSRMGDSFGAIGAVVCAIHCALLPFVLAMLPTLGLGLLASHGIEFLYVAFATLLALASLVQGYLRHRILRALSFAVPGLLTVWAGVLLPAIHDNVVAHAVVMTCGGTLIAIAHLINLKLTHSHAQDACCPH